MLPEVSRLAADMTELARVRITGLNRRVMRMALLGGVPLYATLILGCPFLLKIWLGKQFEPSLPGVFQVIAVGTFLSLIGVPAFYTLMGLGRADCVFLAHLVQGTINAVLLVGLLLMGVPMSATIVAWSVLVSMGGATLYLLWEKQRMLSSDAWQLHFAGVGS